MTATIDQSRPVLILGAGIGGLSTAVGLSRAGIPCRILERAPELRPVGAGLAIQINAMRVLARWGLEGPIAAAGAEMLNTTIHLASGRVLQQLSLAPWRARYGHGAYALHRARLQQELLNGAANVPLELGVDTVGIDARADGVELTLADGRRLAGSVLVGADGLRSQVRRTLWGEEPLRYAGYTSWRGICPNEGRVPLGAANETWGRGRRFGYAAIGYDEVYWFATETTSEEGHDPDDRLAPLVERFGGWHDPIPSLLAAASPANILRADIFDRPPRAVWGRGRVTLLGDAAHPMTPNLGQGACQAIEDAGALSNALAAEPADPSAALRRYEQARAARTAPIVVASWRFGALAQGDTLITRVLRDRLVPLLAPLATSRQLRSLFDEPPALEAPLG